ncbi:DNA replication complex GINS protein PSF1 [Aphelenchoides bicaudatus]|nr:DNA replication complex GINS protein PSF1 [Aphelenchoides bicaudatus]
MANNLSPEELKWLENYNDALFEYQQSFGDFPLTDYGEFETSDGLTVVFRKGTLHLISHKDSETLVKKGILEYV